MQGLFCYKTRLKVVHESACSGLQFHTGKHARLLRIHAWTTLNVTTLNSVYDGQAVNLVLYLCLYSFFLAVSIFIKCKSLN